MPQDPAAMQEQIEATRAELAATVDAIAARVAPSRLAARGRTRARESVGNAAQGVRDAFTHPPATVLDAGDGARGPVRWERVAALVALLVLLAAWRRRHR